MKKILINFMTIVTAVIIVGCQKEAAFQDDSSREDKEMDIAPFEYASLSDLQNAISDYDPKVGTRAVGVSQLSYAQTVMQEEGYDYQPYAIMSESFGSVLNPEGEAIFGDYALKLCHIGILFSTKDNVDLLRQLSDEDELSDKLSNALTFLFEVETLEGIYSIEGYDNTYLYDLFNITGYRQDVVMEEMPETRATSLGDKREGGVDYHVFEMLGEQINQTYTIPNGNANQRYVFSADSKKANDTKIYHENYVVTKERGIKVKTVQKKALGWFKFENDITAALEGLYIAEFFYPKNIGATGWVDVHTTYYDGKSYEIATKVISGYHDVTMSNSEICAECDRALKWAKDQNMNVTKVDGVRYISKARTDVVMVRIKDEVISEYDNVYNLKIGLKSTGSLHSSTSSLGNLIINNANYRIFGMVMSGYSTYGNEKKGSRVYHAYPL